VHEGATDKALAEIDANFALSGAEQDGGTQSGDLNLMGDILREAGRVDEALAKYAKAVDLSEAAHLPAEAKAAAKRNYLFEQSRAALAKKDLATAKAKAAAYATEVAVKKVPFELRQQAELEGLIALEEKRFAEAVQAFKKSNQQDPRILLFTAEAMKGAGDAKGAAAMAAKAANFNQLSFNYGYIRAKAKKFEGTSN
jgi:tetratricopeptide (TPR) repeat protein